MGAEEEAEWGKMARATVDECPRRTDRGCFRIAPSKSTGALRRRFLLGRSAPASASTSAVLASPEDKILSVEEGDRSQNPIVPSHEPVRRCEDEADGRTDETGAE